MGTIGIVNATKMRLYVVTSAGTPPKLDPVANQLSGTLSVGHSLNTSVNKDDGGWEKSRPGARNWAISGDCEFAFDAEYGLAELEAFIANRTMLAVRFSTEESNDYHYRGNCYLESIELSGDAETNLTFSYTFKGTGLLTKEVIVSLSNFASANVTDAGAALSVDVNPEDKACTVDFEFGTDTTYGDTQIATQSPLDAGNDDVTCTTTLSGLIPETTYHWRVKIVNALSVIYSEDQTFTTLAE